MRIVMSKLKGSKGVPFVAFRREFLERVLADPEWRERFEAAETTEQLFKVVEAYCKEKKLEVRNVRDGDMVLTLFHQR